MESTQRNDRKWFPVSNVISADGTAIAYERKGTGPPVVLVGGGLTDRSENGPLADALSSAFTTYNYDRRGRGESGDTQPYALEREIEDIASLIGDAGGPAHLYGVSSGGALALEAAAAGLAVDSLAVYEVPYCTAGDMPNRWNDYVGQLSAALAEGRRGDAVTLFMTLVGTPGEAINGMRSAPFWGDMEALAHTLAYEAACLGDGRPPTNRLIGITARTLVMIGGEGPQKSHMAGLPPDFFDQPAELIASSIPSATRETLDGQTHLVDPQAMASALAEFFAGE
jgi:pimeloyl-ACP methyl ester carboxylesterase